MKKILMMVVLALTTLTMSAQDEKKFTIYAGLGMSGQTGSDADGVKDAFAYKIGANYDVAISESFSIIPGVELANKSEKIDGIDGTINKFYLNIPILAACKISVSDGMKLAVKAGPYIGCGLFGSDVEFYGSDETINVFDKDVYNRFDAGLQAGVSLDFDSFTVGLEYTRGLAKLGSDYKGYNQGYGLTVGYRF